MTTLYGIPNCQSVKKGRAWLDEHGVTYTFHDFKKAGLSPELLEDFLRHTTLETLVNRKGATWRGLDEQTKTAIERSPDVLKHLLLTKPTLIKRPVIAFDSGAFTVGVDEALWEKALLTQPAP